MKTDFVGTEIKPDSKIKLRLGSLQMVDAYIENNIAKPYPFTQRTKDKNIRRESTDDLEIFEYEIREGENRKIAVI